MQTEITEILLTKDEETEERPSKDKVDDRIAEEQAKVWTEAAGGEANEGFKASGQELNQQCTEQKKGEVPKETRLQPRFLKEISNDMIL
eukprot:CAMPEP_0206190024 /NCGR_PEP_ID=MMETSP0166-20121206/4503_1 /ASSEMBLY_ACC=CAM_ASM_000260 /TAXON_ID=95228 /ORGANISM="Vannella robusta, Strain DIVA3 518/3/11/1/6" /LENGTH=88 /DNA_ID=CAMNT_0053606023 /DNA_START=34 /DNA_END=300 /DNA_ORIENTATION=+